MLVFPDVRMRQRPNAGERQRLIRRDMVAWTLVALIHVLFIALLTISLVQNRERFGRRTAIETILDFTFLHRSNAPPVNLIEPDVVDAQAPDISAAPITVTPKPIEKLPENAPVSDADVLGSIGQALACGAGNFENLNPAQQARCRRQPWQGARLPNGTIVLDATPRLAVPQVQVTGAEALRRQMQTNSGCPIISNRPCLSNMFDGGISATGVPDPH